MRREQRLGADHEFLRVRRAGRSWAHPLLVLFAARTAGSGPTRVGVTVGRRVGGAVVRNRARRRVREVVRLAYPALCSGWDLVFVVREGAADVGGGEIARAVHVLLRRSGVMGG